MKNVSLFTLAKLFTPKFEYSSNCHDHLHIRTCYMRKEENSEGTRYRIFRKSFIRVENNVSLNFYRNKCMTKSFISCCTFNIPSLDCSLPLLQCVCEKRQAWRSLIEWEEEDWHECLSSSWSPKAVWKNLEAMTFPTVGDNHGGEELWREYLKFAKGSQRYSPLCVLCSGFCVNVWLLKWLEKGF